MVEMVKVLLKKKMTSALKAFESRRRVHFSWIEVLFPYWNGDNKKTSSVILKEIDEEFKNLVGNGFLVEQKEGIFHDYNGTPANTLNLEVEKKQALKKINLKINRAFLIFFWLNVFRIAI